MIGTWCGEKSNFLSLTECQNWSFWRADHLLFHWLKPQHLWALPGSRKGLLRMGMETWGLVFLSPVQSEEGAEFSGETVTSSEAEAANIKIHLEQLMWTINFQCSWQDLGYLQAFFFCCCWAAQVTLQGFGTALSWDLMTKNLHPKTFFIFLPRWSIYVPKWWNQQTSGKLFLFIFFFFSGKLSI